MQGLLQTLMEEENMHYLCNLGCCEEVQVVLEEDLHQGTQMQEIVGCG
jgi:hypothetical protein